MRFVNSYLPLASVTTGLTGLPSRSMTGLPAPSVRVTVTPGTPASSASWRPFLFASNHTKLPTEAGLTNAKSTFVALGAAVVSSIGFGVMSLPLPASLRLVDEP